MMTRSETAFASAVPAAARRLWRRAGYGCLLLLCGCAENAIPVQVGATTRPMVEIAAGAVVVEPEAITLRIEPGAVVIDAQTAPLPDDIFDRLWLWVGIAAVCGVLGYWLNRWLRLFVRWLRGGGK